LEDPVTQRYLKGTIDLRQALEIRLPCGEGGLVSGETPEMRLSSRFCRPEKGEFHIVTPERIWQLRVLPDEVDDQRDLVRWVRAAQASMDYFMNDEIPTILECLDDIIVSTNIEQCNGEELLVDKYQDMVSVFIDADSRNLFLAYISSALPEISELIAGYYEYIVGDRYQKDRESYAKMLLQTFSGNVRRRSGLSEFARELQNICRSLPMNLENINNLVGEIMRSPTIGFLFEDFLESPKFKLFI